MNIPCGCTFFISAFCVFNFLLPYFFNLGSIQLKWVNLLWMNSLFSFNNITLFGLFKFLNIFHYSFAIFSFKPAAACVLFTQNSLLSGLGLLIFFSTFLKMIREEDNHYMYSVDSKPFSENSFRDIIILSDGV